MALAVAKTNLQFGTDKSAEELLGKDSPVVHEVAEILRQAKSLIEAKEATT